MPSIVLGQFVIREKTKGVKVIGKMPHFIQKPFGDGFLNQRQINRIIKENYGIQLQVLKGCVILQLKHCGIFHWNFSI